MHINLRNLYLIVLSYLIIFDFSKWTPFYIVVITTILMEKRFFVNKIEIEKEIKSD